MTNRISARVETLAVLSLACSAFVFAPVGPLRAAPVQYNSADGTHQVPVSASSPLPVAPSGGLAPSPAPVTTIDRSGTITTGGTAQNAMASNSSRKAWFIQNPCSATENLYVRVGDAASATTGIELAPCAQANNEPGVIDTAAISVFAATTSHAFFGGEKQ